MIEFKTYESFQDVDEETKYKFLDALIKCGGDCGEALNYLFLDIDSEKCSTCPLTTVSYTIERNCTYVKAARAAKKYLKVYPLQLQDEDNQI